VTAAGARLTATVILCGGKGTRAYPHTVEVPKPLLEVASQPVLRHVMELYAGQGYSRFVLAAGFKQELIREFARDLPPSWDVEVVDTGEDTNTGGRILRCRDYVEDTFFATYADGLADIDLEALARFHGSHAGAATLTTVPLPSQYGTLDCDGDGRVRNFREKPVLPDHWINAGFFVFDTAVFDGWEGEDLEREVTLHGLAPRRTRPRNRRIRLHRLPRCSAPRRTGRRGARPDQHRLGRLSGAARPPARAHKPA
jgi:glucose-1-phosphate cytidylyltransferase